MDLCCVRAQPTCSNRRTFAKIANKPFWLQLVGTGITTSWAAHLGAVLDQARWSAITCMNIWSSQLIQPALELRGGFMRARKPDGH